MTQQEREVYRHITHMAEEQVMFLKSRYKMKPQEIIQLYGGKTMGDETYGDAVERIAVFNIQTANKNGFVAN